MTPAAAQYSSPAQSDWVGSTEGKSRTTGLEPGRWTDLSLDQVSPDLEASLRAARESWLSSFGFCTLYALPPASRVRVYADEAAHVANTCYYLECPRRRGQTKLHIFGPTTLTASQLRELMEERRADLATITRMGPEDAAKLSGPWYRCAETVVNEDLIVKLPLTEEEYLHSLGANARTQLPYYLRRVQREWGSGLSVFYAANREISEELFKELVELNRIRIERKGAIHLWHPQLVQQRWRLAQQCGLFCGIRRDGRLVAGTLSFLHRDEAFFVLIGHQTDYDRLRLGKLVLWFTIQRLIQTKFVRYHLLWGKSLYKYQLGGEPQTLSEVTVFRTPWAALLWHTEKLNRAVAHYGGRAARIPAGIIRRLSRLLGSRIRAGEVQQ